MSIRNQNVPVYELMLDVRDLGLVSTRARVFDKRSLFGMSVAISTRSFGRLHKSRYCLTITSEVGSDLPCPAQFPFFVKGAQRNLWWRNPVLDAIYLPVGTVDSEKFPQSINRLWIDDDGVLQDYCPRPIWDLVTEIVQARDPEMLSINLIDGGSPSHFATGLVVKRSRPFDGTGRIVTSFLDIKDGYVTVIEKE